MKRVWVRITLVVLAGVFGGCKATLYTPTPHVMPLFDGDRQVQATASVRHDSGVDVQVAGSPVPYVFLFGSTFQKVGLQNDQHHGELGGGVYFGLPHAMRLELVGGVGGGDIAGSGSHYVGSSDSSLGFEIEEYSYTANYRRSFAQVNLGVEADGGALLVGGAMRVSWVHHEEFVTEPEDLVQEVRGVYAEPAVLFRARVNRYVDLEGLLGYSYQVDGETPELFRQSENYGSVGVRLHLGRQ